MLSQIFVWDVTRVFGVCDRVKAVVIICFLSFVSLCVAVEAPSLFSLCRRKSSPSQSESDVQLMNLMRRDAIRRQREPLGSVKAHKEKTKITAGWREDEMKDNG